MACVWLSTVGAAVRRSPFPRHGAGAAAPRPAGRYALWWTP